MARMAPTTRVEEVNRLSRSRRSWATRRMDIVPRWRRSIDDFPHLTSSSSFFQTNFRPSTHVTVYERWRCAFSFPMNRLPDRGWRSEWCNKKQATSTNGNWIVWRWRWGGTGLGWGVFQNTKRNEYNGKIRIRSWGVLKAGKKSTCFSPRMALVRRLFFRYTLFLLFSAAASNSRGKGVLGTQIWVWPGLVGLGFGGNLDGRKYLSMATWWCVFISGSFFAQIG